MAKATPIKPEETSARGYADRLILEKLTELYEVVKPGEIAEKLHSEGLGLAAVRALLASNPGKFAYSERRWVPAARLEGVGRPFDEAVRIVVERFGGPMSVALITQELVRTRGLDEEWVERAVRRIASTDPRLCLTNADDVVCSERLFVAMDEPVDRALALNGVPMSQVETIQEKLKGFDWLADDLGTRLLGAAAPVNAKALSAAAWIALTPSNPHRPVLYSWREFSAELLSVPGYVLGADGSIHPQADTRKWISTAVRLADKLAPVVDVEDVAPIELKPEDVNQIVERILAEPETETVTRVLEEMYELTPAVKTFPDDLKNTLDLLKVDERVWWVGGDRFRKPGAAPDFINAMPEPFEFEQTEFKNEEDELIDVELTDEGLSSTLRKLLLHPLATDTNDEDTLPPPRNQQETLRLVLKPIHRELGTFPLCQFPTGWLANEPKIEELIFIDPDGRELQVWVNHEVRLLFNLLDWWLDQPVESGAVFGLTKTSRPNVFEFEWLDQTDPIVFISNQRMEELREIGARASELSTFDILREVMTHWPKGADFLTLLWEVNVVRRTSRRLVASLLSSYLCFYQRSGSPVWHYDPKKVDQGFDKSKKKFVKKD